MEKSIDKADGIHTGLLIINEAIREDNSGNISEAIKLYEKALNEFYKAIHSMTDASFREYVEHQTEKYVNRINELRPLAKLKQLSSKPSAISLKDAITSTNQQLHELEIALQDKGAINDIKQTNKLEEKETNQLLDAMQPWTNEELENDTELQQELKDLMNNK